MKEKLGALGKVSLKGSVAGIIVAMLFMLAANGVKIQFIAFLYYLVFGSVTGFSICFFILLAELIFKDRYPVVGKYLLIPQFATIYLVSAAVFFCMSFIISKLLMGYYPPIDQALGTSLWTGVASIIVGLVLQVIEGKEEKLRLEKENRELAVMEERSRIARELHDSVSQNLFGISLNLKTAEYMMDIDIEKSKGIISQLDSMVQEVQTEMRLMIYELRPIHLKNKSFFEALENMAILFRKRYRLDLDCGLTGDEESIDNDKKTALYRIVQEALNNVVKHSNNKKAVIKLDITAGNGNLLIQDFGSGFDTSLPNKQDSIGLISMKERADKIGAFMDIKSSNEGTSISVCF